MSRKPFRVSTDWLYYSHGPGRDSGYPIATELVDMAEEAGWGKYVSIPADREDLVREIVEQAECFSLDRGGDEEDRKRGRRAQRVVNRGRAWLADC